ncbi:MAG: cellulose biosynthesis cyclic di-GMP-binding regulatory protein BcsB [Dictyoglomus sp.]|nr:cellulose biosynthesis cyclic di-GMP-binding regulatory protein BcsB [Dictyoglomus sp.]MCX7942381.1 cellulose biosynthesis cyclic di-GMP-binding regulatory protein BcsB [Dictyoglomaceae bacterium]MDW8188539.1 cellulose biosynthesis cyclic di-GMP-binding regulatory protein BcsB [Dictyoglomus sp.]
MRKKNFIFIIFILILTIFLPAFSFDRSRKINIYNIPILKEGVLLNLPLNKYSFWFFISKGVEVIDNCYLKLEYSYSETLITKLSMVTIYLNGYPIFSRNIVEPGKGFISLKIRIPKARIKQGYNEIIISTKQRSIEGICEDLDNDANWVLLHNTSMLHLETIDKSYKISYFPYPFLDFLKKDVCNFVFYLPKNFDTDEIEVLLYLANELATRERYKNLSYRVSFDNPYEKRGENQILIGKIDKWEFLKKQEFLKYLESGDGLIYMSYHDSLRLYISGDKRGIWKALEYITDEEQIKVAEDNPIIVKTSKDKKYDKENKQNVIRLVDLGFDNLVLSGAFYQGKSFLIKSPVGFEGIGKGSFLELYLSHSPVLEDRSVITVYINGIPVKSEKLDGRNVEKGRIKVYFPQEELDKKEWIVEIKVYHDLKNAPCDKRFEEVAWTKIDGNSLVYFVKDYKEEYPNLKNLFRGSANDIYIWLMNDVNLYELTLLATLVGKIGQNMGLRYNFKIILGDIIDETILSGKDIIFVGKFDDKRIEKIKNYLWIIPSKDKFTFKKDLDIYFDGFTTDVIFQAEKSPFKGVLYSIFYSEADSLIRLNNFLNKTENINKITGQITIITKLGNVYSEILASPEISYRIIFEISPLILYLIVLLAIIILSIILVIWNRKRI